MFAEAHALVLDLPGEQLTAHTVTAHEWQERLHIHGIRISITPQTANRQCISDAQVYAELRRESAVSQGMPIAVRHLESIIRMSEAHAAMHLREYVNEQDVDTAIRYTPESSPGLHCWSCKMYAELSLYKHCIPRHSMITGQSHRSVVRLGMIHAPEAVTVDIAAVDKCSCSELVLCTCAGCCWTASSARRS